MIIVSQDRMQIVNFENVNNVTVEGLRIFSYSNNYNGHDETKAFLGKYKTIGRAQEVLQEIVKTDVLTEQYKTEDERTRIKLMMEGVLMYEMPKE